MKPLDADVLIVGGGINGAVSAAALASRGARVAVIDRGDFAAFTSMQSSNLVWGGFKYLENYEIGLVRNLCKSRNHLIKAYPANLKEIRFMAALDENSPYSPVFAGMPAPTGIAQAIGFWLLINIFLFLYEYNSLPILVSKHANSLEASPCAMSRFVT